MNRIVEQKIREMVQPANPTEDQVLALLAGWDRLFEALQLAEHSQLAEFDGIMRARVLAGSVSLVAPNRIREA
jgi:hypothetical protein